MFNFEGAKFNTFKNVKSICYIGSKLESTFDDNGNEIKNYDKPEKYSFNIHPKYKYFFIYYNLLYSHPVSHL